MTAVTMDSALPSLPSLESLLYAAPTLSDQIWLGLAHSVFWYIMLWYVIPPITQRIVNGLPCKEQFLLLNRDTFKKAFFWDLGDDMDHIFEQVTLFLGVIVQHGVGGALCLPSVLGLGGFLPTGVAGAMARHGALCETGWEIEDTLCRICQILFGGEAGKKKNPTPVLIILAFHHSCAQCMVIPLNIYYPENTYYHEAVMLLQLAAFVAFMAQQYGFTLNVKSADGLLKMKVSISVAFFLILWSRVLRYGFLWYMLLSAFYSKEEWFLLKMATAPVILMSLFNVLIVMDAGTKFFKFIGMSLKTDTPEAVQASHQMDLVACALILTPMQAAFIRSASSLGEEPMLRRLVSPKTRLKGAIHTVIASNRLQSSVNDKDD